MDRPDVVRDIFAHPAVSPGGGTDELAVLKPEIYGRTIQLGLGRVLQITGRVQTLLNTPVEVLKVFPGEGIVQRQHGETVGNLTEARSGSCAHALRGRVWTHQPGIPTLQLNQRLVEPVVDGVRHDGRV